MAFSKLLGAQPRGALQRAFASSSALAPVSHPSSSSSALAIGATRPSFLAEEATSRVDVPLQEKFHGGLFQGLRKISDTL